MNRCPICGESLPDESGACPTCLAPTTPHAPRDLPTTDELARLFPELEILGLLGRGGMGAVYRARQPHLDRLVALKVLPPRSSDPDAVARFSREARAMARLRHPNIVTIFESGRKGDLYYFLMEFVPGRNLRQVMTGGPVPPAEAVRIVLEVCAGLGAAHEMGHLHRDVKPENILLDERGRVQIADFGLTRPTDPAGDARLTRSDQVMGTFAYMAPEQFHSPLDVDHRADLYSVGVVFYELLTGRRPQGRFEPPSRLCDCGERFDAVVLRALEQDPSRRHQTAAELRAEVEALQDVAPVAIRSAPPPLPPASPISTTPFAAPPPVAGAWSETTPRQQGAPQRGGAPPVDALRPALLGPALLLLASAMAYGVTALLLLGVLVSILSDDPQKRILELLQAEELRPELLLRPPPGRIRLGPFVLQLNTGSCLLLILASVSAALLLGEAAVCLLRRRHPRRVWWAAVFALVPLGPAWLLALPAGVWTLVVLRRPLMDEAVAPTSARTQPNQTTRQGA
jgi:hypothetical protein